MLFKKTKPAPQRPNRRLVPRKRLHARAASGGEEIDDYESEAEPSMKLSQAFIVVLILHVVAVGGIYGFNKLKETSAKPVAAKKEAAPVVSEKGSEPMVEAKSQTQTQSQALAAKPAAAETVPQTYTVVAGDTLKKIASKFKTSIEALEKANNLTGTSIIRTGQVLVVGKTSSSHAAPASAKSQPVPVSQATPSVVAKPAPVQPVAAKTAPAAPVAETKSAAGQSYIVAKGDNPYSIAKKFKVNQGELMKANNIDDPRKLKIGQTLVIP
jgi:LysM repeat protein